MALKLSPGLKTWSQKRKKRGRRPKPSHATGLAWRLPLGDAYVLIPLDMMGCWMPYGFSRDVYVFILFDCSHPIYDLQLTFNQDLLIVFIKTFIKTYIGVNDGHEEG